jgi:hypothetical protein
MIKSILILVGILFSTSVGTFVTNYIVNSKLKGKLADNEIPLAIYVLKAFLFVALGLLLSEILVPLQTLGKVLPASFSENDLKLNAVMYFSLISTIALFTFVVIWWLSAIFFGLFSSGRNVYIEALNNNIGLVILFSAILLAFAFATKPCLSIIVDHLIPYPKMPIFR